ncbi:hypothetical protein Taro_043939 [Colocasia esculenta]|uniref:WAT1-related protein n=1 Tax=Colocasia esculenta TaxID=4460 RepID=A0A843WMD6_COLES|nr:hypothetical protein [Colocasia esculenta]
MNPYFVAILIWCIYVEMYILSKIAFDKGMNIFVFVFYRQAAATLFTATLFTIPFAILSRRIMLTLDLYSVGLDYTSASVASATSNSVPVITFFLALMLSDKLDDPVRRLNKKSGQFVWRY